MKGESYRKVKDERSVAAVGEAIEAEGLEVAAVVVVVVAVVWRKTERGSRTAHLTSTHSATCER